MEIEQLKIRVADLELENKVLNQLNIDKESELLSLSRKYAACVTNAERLTAKLELNQDILDTLFDKVLDKIS